MNWTIEEIASDMAFVELNNGELCFVNGYMLESVHRKAYYPLTVHYNTIINAIPRR